MAHKNSDQMAAQAVWGHIAPLQDCGLKEMSRKHFLVLEIGTNPNPATFWVFIIIQTVQYLIRLIPPPPFVPTKGTSLSLCQMQNKHHWGNHIVVNCGDEIRQHFS